MEAVTRLAQHDAGDLIASAAAGDEYAFRRLIAAHHDDMRRVCVYVAGDRAIADEATQAAWVIAWNKIGSVREPERLRPWLMAVAMNKRQPYRDLEREYITTDISIRELCRRHGIRSHSVVVDQSQKHDWPAKREAYRARASES